jgi:competence protein ComEA
MTAPLRASLLVAALLLGLALPGDAPRLRPCPRPAELAARGEHTSRVGCSGGAPLRGPARRLFGQALDANRADAASLETLPGIGPARAAAIVAERARRPFQRVADLERVPGIGPATLRAIAPWLAVGGASVDSTRAEVP